MPVRLEREWVASFQNMVPDHIAEHVHDECARTFPSPEAARAMLRSLQGQIAEVVSRVDRAAIDTFINRKCSALVPSVPAGEPQRDVVATAEKLSALKTRLVAADEAVADATVALLEAGDESELERSEHLKGLNAIVEGIRTEIQKCEAAIPRPEAEARSLVACESQRQNMKRFQLFPPQNIDAEGASSAFLARVQNVVTRLLTEFPQEIVHRFAHRYPAGALPETIVKTPEAVDDLLQYAIGRDLIVLFGPAFGIRPEETLIDLDLTIAYAQKIREILTQEGKKYTKRHLEGVGQAARVITHMPDQELLLTDGVRAQHVRQNCNVRLIYPATT